MPKVRESRVCGPAYEVVWESADRITMASGFSRWRWLATVKAFWHMVAFRARCRGLTSHYLEWN